MPNFDQQLAAGWALHQAGDLTSAEAAYRNVLSERPTHPNAWVYLGIALFDRRSFAQSVDAYRNALDQQDHFPIAWNNLGNSLRMLGQTEEAESCFEKSLAQQPGYLSALKNRGTLWVWAGEVERGLQWYRQGLQISPDDAELHRNLGVIQLLQGNYEEGWREYRWRWKMPGMRRPRTQAQLWRGQTLVGKTFLLYPEQGLGDAIHFVRMAGELKELGAKVILQCSRLLLDLFSSTTNSLGVDELTIDSAVAPPADYHASLIEVADILYGMNQQIAFGEKWFTNGLAQDASASLRSGYLGVSGELVAYWQAWLNENLPENRLRIGINWQGNPGHHADVYRSVPLNLMAPLAQQADWQLINLQFGHGSEQLSSCEFGDSVFRLPQHVDQGDPATKTNAFTDTAAILSNLDAVITTDTSVAHLAGALGISTHVLLGRVPDWRWLAAGAHTSWYPSMTLHRQKEIGVWDDVMESVVETLGSSERSTR